MICILLDVANNCVVLQNYNAVMAILTALQGAALTRLKYTWEVRDLALEGFSAHRRCTAAPNGN